MRTLTSTPPQPKRRVISTPSEDKSSPHNTIPTRSTPIIRTESTPSQYSERLDSRRSPFTTTPQSDLQAQNRALREDLARLRLDRQLVLDHSIESDQRLLRFTENVFLSHSEQDADGPNQLPKSHQETQTEAIINPCNKCKVLTDERNSMIFSIKCLKTEVESLRMIAYPSVHMFPQPPNSSLTSDTTDGGTVPNKQLGLYTGEVLGLTTIDCAVQCDLKTDRCEEKHITILAENTPLHKNVEELQSTILTLQEKNNYLQEKCDILNEEATNMINSIRALEEDIKLKNKQISENEVNLTKHYERIRELTKLNKQEYANLLEYHRQYPKDNFKCLSKRMLEELHCRDRDIKMYTENIKCLQNKIKELQNVPVNATQNYAQQTPTTSSIPIHNSFETLKFTPPDETEFQTVSYRRRKKPKPNTQKKHYQTTLKTDHNNQTISNTKPKSNPIAKIPFSHVSVIGDSHARHLTSLMAERTSHQTKITGVCKPGAGLLSIAPTTTALADTKTDCLVLLAGTNDVASGRQDTIFKYFEASVVKCSQTSRVLVCPLPTRYDLPQSSTIHKAVAEVNHYIEEICSRHDNMDFLDISCIGRQYYTSHGLHLRASGKRLLARLILEKLESLPRLQRRYNNIASSTIGNKLPMPPSDRPTTLPYETFAEAVRQKSSNRHIPYGHYIPPHSFTERNNSHFLGKPF